MTITVCGRSPSRPCTTEALSKWRITVSAALGLRPSPSHSSSMVGPPANALSSKALFAFR